MIPFNSPSSTTIQDLKKKSLQELMRIALEVKLHSRGNRFSFCSIINAKSGKCSEDCRFCVQSGHYSTSAPNYPLLGKEEIVSAAKEAKTIGAHRFSIVTSGRGMGRRELLNVAEIVTTIREKVSISVCASLGIQSREDFDLLREAGLSRYHHNLETSKEYFAQVVSTHSYEQRVATVRAAQDAGLEVCVGGIFGLGESEEDRISMALTLRELKIDSVPLNMLIPLPGTPLADRPQLTVAEALRGIAIYRILMPGISIRLAAGRETVLRDFLGAAMMAGADGMMIGGYLTQGGRAPEEDHRLMKEMVQIWKSYPES